ncbi:MAG: hypothetical protein ACRC7O_01485, partial [Fimbriiglobus sp.]
ITVGGVSVKADEFSITVKHFIDRERFLSGSLTLTEVNALDREVSFSTKLPYGDHAAIYNSGNAAGAAIVLSGTNGGATFGMSMPKVHFPREMAATPGRQELFLPINGLASMSTASTDEIAITLNPGP